MYICKMYILQVCLYYPGNLNSLNIILDNSFIYNLTIFSPHDFESTAIVAIMSHFAYVLMEKSDLLASY